jgi:hypothetical protein
MNIHEMDLNPTRYQHHAMLLPWNKAGFRPTGAEFVRIFVSDCNQALFYEIPIMAPTRPGGGGNQQIDASCVTGFFTGQNIT